METRYETFIETLNEEILRLRTELALSQSENQRLLTSLDKTEKEHGIRLQNIQAHHERKILKLKTDIETCIFKSLL